MRLPRFRFTLRWTMLAVAIAALLIAMTPMRDRAAYCHGRALAFDGWAEECRASIRDYESLLANPSRIREELIRHRYRGDELDRQVTTYQCFIIPSKLADVRRDLERDLGLKQRWLEAAARPWLAVPPNLQRMRDLRHHEHMDQTKEDRLSGGDPP